MPKTEELEQFRQMLRLIQARLRGDVLQMEEEALSGQNGDHSSSNHIGDMGSDAWSQDFSLSMVEKDGEFLDEIAVALKKIDDGTYGMCEMCLESGKPQSKAKIPKARLKAIPYARNCVECERRREDGQ
ncbi:MAG: TraR/DksA family transcriptional regulator [Planctomycetaceae bacterium]